MMTRILIVEDKKENLFYLSALLTGHGYMVETARHGEEALARARANPPEIIISDLLMPIMDGYTLLRQWKADSRFRAIPFIVYTATYTDEEDERLAVALGADAFILKPCEPDRFIARLREVEGVGASRIPAGSNRPAAEEESLLKSYSETLVRKLEEKSRQLEEANYRLEQDILERTKAEMLQRQMADTQTAILNALPAHIALIDSDGMILSVNEAWRQFGKSNALRSEDFCVGKNYLDVCDRVQDECSSRTAKETASGIRRVLRGESGEFVIEYPCHSPTEERWFRLMVTPLHEKECAGAVVMHVNITERKKAEQETKQALRRLTEAQRIGRIGDWEWDMATDVINWSPQVYDILGRDPVGGPPKDAEEQFLLYEPASQAVQKERVRQAIDSGQPQSSELVALRPDGKRVYVQATAVPRKNESGQVIGLYGTIQDITERKDMEQQFLRAQRMESIGALAGGIAHDFNNLLVPIVMGIDFIKHANPAQPVLSILKTMEDCATRGRGLVKQVLSFAQGADRSWNSVHLGEIVKEVESILGNTFPKNISVEVAIQDDLWPVGGDPTHLNQVVLNLCVNARDAMQGGGRLKISVENTEVDDLFATTSGRVSSGRYVLLEVADEGCGMSADTMRRVFEPFFTTKETGKGTGLGLSTVRRIIHGHGGSVDVTSRPGKGSVFRVYLPAQTGKASTMASSETVESLPRGNGELILVVDDEASIRNISKQTLEAFGYRVLVASDGAQAVALYVSTQEQISLVMTDLIMPVMDGVALNTALRKINPDLQIIIVSGESRAKYPDIKHFLSKPFSVRQMLTVIQSVLASRHE